MLMTKQDFAKKIRQSKKIVETLCATDINEADTVFHLGNFLSDAFGYDNITDISREFAVRSTYCDYAIKINDKLAFMIEVKAMPVQLKDNHLRQVIGYAMNAGVEWCLLTNCKEFRFYHIEFTKPIDKKLVFSTNLLADDIKEIIEKLWYLTKASFRKNEILNYWNAISALSDFNLATALLSPEIIKQARRVLKKNTGAHLDSIQIAQAIRKLFDDSLNNKITLKRPLKPKFQNHLTNKGNEKELTEVSLDKQIKGDVG